MTRVLVVLVDEQPLLLDESLPVARISAKRPRQLLAVQVEVQLACVDGAAGSSVCAGVHVPRSQTITSPPPYSPAWDHALEVGVLERMVLDVHGQLAGGRIERRPLRDGPAGQHAVDLQPEVVVQAPRAMALDDEVAASCSRASAGGLGGDVEVAHGAVLGQLLLGELVPGATRHAE